MTEWEDYYQILGVDPEASEDEIKKAYKEKVFIRHPDRLTGIPEGARRRAEEELKKINRAYDVLKDPQKRREYHSEWLERSGKVKPKPVAEPQYIKFRDVEPGNIETSSFTIRNIGGAYSKIWISNPESWVRVVRWHSLSPEDELPLRVEIEAEGKDWGKGYSEYIIIKLDEEETWVTVELQTRPEPVKEKAWAAGISKTKSAPAPPPVYAQRKMSAWGGQRLSADIFLQASLRAAIAASIFGLSFLLYRWTLTIYLSPDPPASLPTPWIYSILALVAMVLLASFVVGSYLWAMIFGVSFCAGYFGMLPHPEVGISGALITTFVGGPIAGGICCLLARLGKRIRMKKKLLIALSVVIVIVVIGIIRVSGLVYGAGLPTEP